MTSFVFSVLPAPDPLLQVEDDRMPGTMAHAYNPSYSGGRDQEDRSSKPA
jgi:hypothetical protein